MPTARNQKIARRVQDQAEVCWGDLRDAPAIHAAVQDREVVLHLGFVIPKLSVTGINSEELPDLAYGVNVGGKLWSPSPLRHA